MGLLFVWLVKASPRGLVLLALALQVGPRGGAGPGLGRAGLCDQLYCSPHMWQHPERQATHVHPRGTSKPLSRMVS